MNKWILIILVLSSTLFLTNCGDSDPYYPPVHSCFSTDFPNYRMGEEIYFINCSNNSNRYIWNFGDGYESEAIEPIHYYTTPGTYTITLTAYGAGGDVRTSQKTILITAPPVQSCFSTQHTEYYTGEDIIFNNCSSNANRYLWNFGDGFQSETFEPTHFYDNPGDYTVTLTSYGIDGQIQTSQKMIRVIAPRAGLSILVLYYGTNTPVPNCSVRLYGSQYDFDNETNMIAEGFTDEYGIIEFSGLLPVSYFIDAYIDASNGVGFYCNWDLGIMTDPLLPNIINEYDIEVDYRESKKKKGLKIKKIAPRKTSRKKK